MTKKLNVLLLLLTLILLFGCTNQNTHSHLKLRLAVSPWIGYSPIYYAEEMGWLEEYSIEVIHSTSLQETIHYFQADLIDAFVSTQYEASIMNKDELTHLMPIDRSNGGDVILSNRSLETILKSKNIKVFLEIDSVNSLVFDTFIDKYSLQNINFNVINKEQTLIKNIEVDQNDDLLIITYEPYATTLRRNGFQEIASTKESGILVLDSLYFNLNAYEQHAKQINILNSIIKKAYKKLQEDPKAYYEKVKHNLENPTYLEFSKSLTTIEWLIDKDKEEINLLLKNHNIMPIRDINVDY